MYLYGTPDKLIKKYTKSDQEIAKFGDYDYHRLELQTKHEQN